MPADDNATFEGFALVREHVAPYGGAVAGAMVLMLFGSVAALASPWLAGEFARAVIGEGGTAAAILSIWVAVLAAQALLKFAHDYLLMTTGARVVTDLSRRLYDHLQALPIGFHHRRRPGELLALLSNDAATLGHFVTGPLVAFLPLLLTFFGAALMMARIDWLVASAAVLSVPLFYLLFKVLGRRLRPLAADTQREQADVIAVAEEGLGLLPVVKAFAREPAHSARFRQQTQTVLELRARQFRLQSMLGPLTQFLGGMLLLGLLWLASERLGAQRISVAEIVSLVLYALLMTRPLSGLANLYGQVRQAQGALARVVEVMAERPEPIGSGGRVIGRAGGGIAFRDVEFAYPSRPPLLRGVELSIAPGETVAVTGPNGAGKSTLAALLLRFFDPAAGAILVDGEDIRTLNLAGLRRQFGYVPQQVLIANGTIRDNIAFGAPDATDAEIVAAARAAQAAEFIDALPDGFATEVGDRGVRLSGGQRQRLALARALLIDPPMLVLDEATAALDSVAEDAFAATCGAVFDGRTVLVISHSPAMQALADRHLVLDAGRLWSAADHPAEGTGT